MAPSFDHTDSIIKMEDAGEGIYASTVHFGSRHKKNNQGLTLQPEIQSSDARHYNLAHRATSEELDALLGSYQAEPVSPVYQRDEAWLESLFEDDSELPEPLSKRRRTNSPYQEPTAFSSRIEESLPPSLLPNAPELASPAASAYSSNDSGYGTGIAESCSNGQISCGSPSGEEDMQRGSSIHKAQETVYVHQDHAAPNPVRGPAIISEGGVEENSINSDFEVDGGGEEELHLHNNQSRSPRSSEFADHEADRREFLVPSATPVDADTLIPSIEPSEPISCCQDTCPSASANIPIFDPEELAKLPSWLRNKTNIAEGAFKKSDQGPNACAPDGSQSSGLQTAEKYQARVSELKNMVEAIRDGILFGEAEVHCDELEKACGEFGEEFIKLMDMAKEYEPRLSSAAAITQDVQAEFEKLRKEHQQLLEKNHQLSEKNRRLSEENQRLLEKERRSESRHGRPENYRSSLSFDNASARTSSLPASNNDGSDPTKGPNGEFGFFCGLKHATDDGEEYCLAFNTWTTIEKGKARPRDKCCRCRYRVSNDSKFPLTKYIILRHFGANQTALQSAPSSKRAMGTASSYKSPYREETATYKRNSVQGYNITPAIRGALQGALGIPRRPWMEPYIDLTGEGAAGVGEKQSSLEREAELEAEIEAAFGEDSAS